MRDFWFAPLPEGAKTANKETINLWYGVGSPEKKEAFDKQCRENFGDAVLAIGPENLELPAFESHEKDYRNADELSQPLFGEVQAAFKRDTKLGSDTLLALILLLDQMPRNMFRDHAGLKKVYNHYDRISLALLRSSLDLSPYLVEHPFYYRRPTIGIWYIMPFMHIEDARAHEPFVEILSRWKEDFEEAGEDREALLKQANDHLGFQSAYAKQLKYFGRYPHRNAALGRKSSKEEVEFLKTGNYPADAQGGSKDEEWEKSEL